MPQSIISRAQLDPEVQKAEEDFYGLTSGRSKELANDPYQNSVMQYLQGVVGGKESPFNDTVKNSILSQQGQAAVSAEQAQMQALRDSLQASGGSIYDPGYQAAQREAMAQRQGAGLDAIGQVETTAALENHKAKMQGASQLASARGAQNAQINQMNLAAANQKAQKTAAVPQQPQQQQPQQRKQTPWDISQQVSAQNKAAFGQYW